MANVFRLTESDVPYTALLNLNNAMVFITGDADGLDISGGTSVTVQASGDGDSLYMRGASDIAIHDHGTNLHVALDGNVGDVTIFGVANDPGFLMHVQGINLEHSEVGAPTLNTDYHGGTLVTFAGVSTTVDFVGDQHIGYIVGPSGYPADSYNFFNS